MDRANPDKRRGREAPDEKRVFSCPVCAYEPHRVIVILDTTHRNRTVRVFECECGELIWDD